MNVNAIFEMMDIEHELLEENKKLKEKVESLEKINQELLQTIEDLKNNKIRKGK